ncbi:MAG: type IX secretion system outer membrane channel protein PorV [Cytophagaceae bacterium]
MIKKYFALFPVCALIIICHYGQAQNSITTDQLNGRMNEPRVITTAVPFLTISPDARSGGMADVGVAISPDANAMYWNPAKLAFVENNMGFSLSYNPWLRKLVNDMSLSYLSGYKRIRKEEAIGLSLNYFNLGSIQFTDQMGNPMQTHNPKEYSFAGGYSRKLSQTMGVGIVLKYIHSNLSGNMTFANGTTSKPGNTAAADVGLYYRDDYIINGTNTNIALGLMISNIGAKISYSNNANRDFIPTNLKLGTAITTELDPYNKFVFAFDVNKLLVPTPPVYYPRASGGGDSLDADGNRVIYKGQNPDRPLLSGMFGSFTDAPGGAREELQELILSGGVEYWYNDLFAVRGGYFYENRLKGNRKYFTLGFGIRYQVFGLDFAYLIPVRSNNPLAETLRFTLHFNFETKDQRGVDSVTD